jgi:quercetin dioxygenase-like cupin family protein
MRILRHIRAADIEPELPDGHWKMSARELAHYGDRLRVQLCQMEATGGAESHVHAAHDQVFVVVEGRLQVAGPESEEVTAAAGEAVHVPAGTPHATVAAGTATTYITLTFPAAEDASTS